MRVSPKQLATVLYELTEGKSKSEIEKSISDFARYLQKDRKLKLADKIIEQFGKIYNQKKEIAEAEVVSRRKLGEAELKKIKHFVKEKYRAKEVVLENVVDENIGGGIRLNVGDEVMDGSIQGKLNEIKKFLV